MRPLRVAEEARYYLLGCERPVDRITFASPSATVPGLEASFAALMVLKKPIEFESVDDLPVDVVFAAVVPEGSNDY